MLLDNRSVIPILTYETAFKPLADAGEGSQPSTPVKRMADATETEGSEEKAPAINSK